MKTLITAALCFMGAFASAQTANIDLYAKNVENHVSPRLYAAFAELMAEDVKWGLTAEMVHDRSFEESPDYLGLPAKWNLEPDERNDNGGAITFAQSADEAYPKSNAATGAAEHSLQVTLRSVDVSDRRRGFSQGRISVQAGRKYAGYFWAKVPQKDGYSGNIDIALEEDNTDGETYAEASVAISVGDWRRYDFSLTAGKTDRLAKLAFLFDGKGTLYLDQISLSPADAQNGVRADSEAMIRALHPSFLRWPGGSVTSIYHWKWGIGPRDQRPVWVNSVWSKAPEPDDFGTDEYLALCARLHIEPSITVNVAGAGATANEAAEWVEYVNGPVTSRFGAMRAANGHPQPYNVKQWELGNELWGSADYPIAAQRYAKAMRAVDPSLKLIAVGASPSLEGADIGEGRHFGSSDAWNASVLKSAGSLIDYLAIHDYSLVSTDANSPNPRAKMMARPSEYETAYRHIAGQIRRYAPGRNIKLIVNEWNLFYSSDVIQSMEGAVYASRMMNVFERNGDIVEESNISDLLNGWVGGIIQASRDRIYGTAQYYAIKMYGDALGTERIHTQLDSPNLAATVPSVDAVATRSADGTKLFLKISNADQSHAIGITIRLHDFLHELSVDARILAAPANGLRRNSFSNPDAVVPVDHEIQCADTCVVQMPADSVAVLTFVKRRH